MAEEFPADFIHFAMSTLLFQQNLALLDNFKGYHKDGLTPRGRNLG
jgi:hypothetical protein